MNRNVIVFFLSLTNFIYVFSQQQGSIKGRVFEEDTNQAIHGVSLTIEGGVRSVVTDNNGIFILEAISEGDKILVVFQEGYFPLKVPISIVEGERIDLGVLYLSKNIFKEDTTGIIMLSEEELHDNESLSNNITGLLQSSRDIFSKTAAYDFSATFFRPRGYGSEHSKVLINGVSLNKIYDGRPQWANWGGINDVQRNQLLSNGLSPSDVTFGGIGGATNMIMRASQYREGGKVSLTASSRSYTARVMGSYSSGLNEKGWAYTVLASRRSAEEGFYDGTVYDANAFFIAVEKKFNDKHSLNFTGIYTPNRRGRTAANTQEVYDLKGLNYNPYWGRQQSEKRNSRIRNVQEPIFMLNHTWRPSLKTEINTNIAYQFGRIGNSRLDYTGSEGIFNTNGSLIGYRAGGANPDPSYYQKLPSYFINRGDLAGAFEAENTFQADGQIDWARMYAANLSNGYSIYYLYEDVNEDTSLTFNSIINRELSENITINGKVEYRNVLSDNYAQMMDLMGGLGTLDIDTFEEDIALAPNNILDPSRIVKEGDRFKYHFELRSTVLDGFLQAQFNYRKVDFYIGTSISNTNFQREGFYENPYFIGNNSLGKSKHLNFTNFGVKGGATYKLTGRHLLDFNVGYLTKAPTVRNSFTNNRESNQTVAHLEDEKILSLDASYVIRGAKLKAKFTGYYTDFSDATDISFYYIDGVRSGEDFSAFVQEVATGVGKRNMGVEIGLEYQITPTITLKGVSALGQNYYTNNPNIQLYSDGVESDLGEAFLKDYKVSGGPQRASSLGFEYRDPKYWFFGATMNYFSNNYIDISAVTRTANFYTNPVDGMPFDNYNPEVARELLKQEKFDDHFLVNAVGGKSWKIDSYYVGFFATISNILGREYKTGGFEQSRNGNYQELLEDQANNAPQFGSKYWYGYGRSYFFNIYARF